MWPRPYAGDDVVEGVANVAVENQAETVANDQGDVTAEDNPENAVARYEGDVENNDAGGIVAENVVAESIRSIDEEWEATDHEAGYEGDISENEDEEMTEREKADLELRTYGVRLVTARPCHASPSTSKNHINLPDSPRPEYDDNAKGDEALNIDGEAGKANRTYIRWSTGSAGASTSSSTTCV